MDRVPHVGDIEVLQPEVNGANKSYGHVGIRIDSWAYNQQATDNYATRGIPADTSTVSGCELSQCF